VDRPRPCPRPCWGAHSTPQTIAGFGRGREKGGGKGGKEKKGKVGEERRRGGREGK